MEDLVTVRKSDKWFLSSIVGQRKTCFFSENSRSSSNRSRVCFFLLRVSGQRRECETRGVLHARGEGWEKVTSTNIFIFKTHERSCVSHSEERLKKKENFSCFSNTISNPPGAVVAFKFSAPFTLTIKLNYQLSNKYFLVEIGYMILILNVPAVIERSISSSESIMCRVTVRKIVTNY